MRPYIQDDVLRFSYRGGAGRFQIVLPAFFPAYGKNLRGLLRTIDLSADRYQITQELLHWLEEHYTHSQIEPQLKAYANACVDARTKAKEMEEPILKQADRVRKLEGYIKSLKRGSPAKKQYRELLKAENEKLKGLKEKKRSLEGDARYNNGQFIKLQARQKRAEDNIAIVREWRFSAVW